VKNSSRNSLHRDSTTWFKFSVLLLICITAFMLYPFVYSIILSLYSHKGLKATYVGLGNYVKMFKDPTFIKSITNNFIFLLVQVPIMLILGLFFAYILQNDNLRFKGFFRTAIFLPCVTSLVAYSIVFRTMFQVDGLVNQILQNLNIIKEPIPWLTERGWARALVIIALCWRWTGYNTMYYIAGLQNVPRDIIEAAKIDGCNAVQAFFKIVVPQLKQVIVFTSVTSTIGTLQLFDEITTLTKGGPANGTMTVSYYIFKQSFELNNNYGYSAAMSWVIVLIIAILSIIQLRITRED
jgi:lactose/L-arabinose transport system permease protein